MHYAPEVMREEEAQDWRIERYSDETDAFAAIHWFVMRGNVVIAQCEVQAHAERILFEHQQYEVYARVLVHIAGMSATEHDIEAALEAARRALDTKD
jgi:tRNA(Ser,Leu) C12 N-acetylase TAN1